MAYNIASAASGVLRDAHYEVTGLNRVKSSDLMTSSPWTPTELYIDPSNTSLLTATRADAATCATYVDSNGTLQTVAANVLRNAHYVGGVGPTILLEPSRANLFLNNRDATNAAFTKTRLTAAKNATGLDQVASSASTLTEDNSNNSHFVQQNVTKAASALPYAFSVDVKPNGRTFIQLQLWDNASNGVVANFTLTGSGTAGAASGFGTPFTAASTRIVALTGTNAGWYRCTIAATSNTAVTVSGTLYLCSALGTFSYAGDSASGVLTDYFSLEQAGVETSRIATAGSAVTRAADSATVSLVDLPQVLTAYLDGYFTAAVDATTNYHGWHIGSGSSTAEYAKGRLDGATLNVDAFHVSSAGSSTSSAGVATSGARLEHLAQISSGGAVTSSSAVDGGSTTAGSAGTARAFDSAWSATTLRLGACVDGTQPAVLALRSFKLASGTQTMAVMGAVTAPAAVDAGSAPAGCPANGWTLSDTGVAATPIGGGRKQPIYLDASVAHTFSVFAKAGTATTSYFGVYKQNGGGAWVAAVTVTWTAGVPTLAALTGSPTIYDVQPIGAGWYRLSFSKSITYTDSLELKLLTTGGTTSYAAPQVEKRSGASGYMPAASGDFGFRFERATLVEGARTNQALYSNDLTNWTNVGARNTLTLNQTGPDGTSNSASKFLPNASAGTHEVRSAATVAITANTTQALSAYFKASGYTKVRFEIFNGADELGTDVDLTTGAVTAFTAGTSTYTNGGAEYLPGGWVRVWFAGKVNAASTSATLSISVKDASGNLSFTGDAASFVIVYGVQHEKDKQFPSSVVPTTNASVPRNADLLSRGYTDVPGAVTLYGRFKFRAADDAGDQNIFFIGTTTPNSGTAKAFLVRYNGGYSGGTLYFTHQNGSSSTGGLATYGISSLGLIVGDIVEYCIVVNADGSTQVFVSKNGGTVQTGVVSPALAFAAAFDSANIYFSVSGDTIPSMNSWFQNRVERKVKTMAQMRALAGVAA